MMMMMMNNAFTLSCFERTLIKQFYLLQLDQTYSSLRFSWVNNLSGKLLILFEARYLKSQKTRWKIGKKEAGNDQQIIFCKPYLGNNTDYR